MQDDPGLDVIRNLPRNLSAALFSIPDNLTYLERGQLEALQRSFRSWKDAARKADSQRARMRIWLIFLILRYTGARLGEVLSLQSRDFDLDRGIVIFGDHKEKHPARREVLLPESLLREIRGLLPAVESMSGPDGLFRLDQGYLRRIFYKRAQEAGLDKSRACPTVLRKSRAVEMLRSGTPLSLVQQTLGLEGPKQALKEYSQDALTRLQSYYVHVAGRDKTSARNAFIGPVNHIERGPVMCEVVLHTREGLTIAACITAGSLDRLGIAIGSPVMATVKAPLVDLTPGGSPPVTSARNAVPGQVTSIRSEAAISEVELTHSSGLQLCALMSTHGLSRLDLLKGDPATAFFKALAVVLQVD